MDLNFPSPVSREAGNRRPKAVLLGLECARGSPAGRAETQVLLPLVSGGFSVRHFRRPGDADGAGPCTQLERLKRFLEQKGGICSVKIPTCIFIVHRTTGFLR